MPLLIAWRLVSDGVAPDGFGLGVQGLYVACVGVWMALWWMTECVPIAATSLLPAALLPGLGLVPMKNVASAYASPFILLLLAGFMAALAIERFGLHKRVALAVLARFGGSPRRLILGVMVACALSSMWISNTASTLMVLPVAAALVRRAEALAESSGNPARATDARNFGLALMLGMAYAASVGGLGTPIGTPPNLVFLDELERSFGEAQAIGFVDWMAMGLPVVVLLVPAIWLYLTRLAAPVSPELRLGSGELIRTERAQLGRASRDEWTVGAVFVAMAVLWVTRKIRLDGGEAWGWAPALGLDGYVHDATVAVAGALALFVLPSKTLPGERLLDWPTAKRVPWDLVLLFGGGVALAGAFKASGLSAAIAEGLASLPVLPTPMLILTIALVVTFLTEITSNTATTIVLMPVLAGYAVAAELPPEHVMLPAVLSASCAFMLPVATAPNAIVYGTGRVPVAQMARIGFAINVAAALLMTLLLWTGLVSI